MPSFRLTKNMPIATATVLDGSQFVAAAPIATVLGVQRVESPLLADLVASEIAYVRGDGTMFGVAATDAVIQVFAMDAARFAMANEAKRSVHLWAGNPGTLTAGFSVLQLLLCTPPWTIHTIVFPCTWIPCLVGNSCTPHEDAPFPDRAARALILTEYGVVADGAATGAATSAIAWDGFDVDAVALTRYDDDDESRCTGVCGERGIFDDPLSCALGCGVMIPCCAFTCVQPHAPGLYRLRIESTATTTTGRGKKKRTRPTATVDLFALAGSPDAVVAALRRGAASARAPPAATMHDRD
ncbi:hypothetical protein JL722_3343 [Aureococcus anophagefferens]|nr:hypothetical protein JL722_3343 [Aureococcus anophagefferens]